MPSLRGSSTSSSWPLSPGCVLRGSSCTSCLWRCLRANTHGRSTIMCLVTSSPPLWLASPQLSTTGATGPRKRKSSFLNTFLEMPCRHAGCCTVWAYLLCLRVAHFEKKSTHHFCQHLMCIPGDYPKTFELPFARDGQLFNFLCHLKGADRLNTVVSGEGAATLMPLHSKTLLWPLVCKCSLKEKSTAQKKNLLRRLMAISQLRHGY